MSKARKQLQERHSTERKAPRRETRQRTGSAEGRHPGAAHRRQWQEEKRALEAEGFGLVLSFKGSGSEAGSEGRGRLRGKGRPQRQGSGGELAQPQS